MDQARLETADHPAQVTVLTLDGLADDRTPKPLGEAHFRVPSANIVELLDGSILPVLAVPGKPAHPTPLNTSSMLRRRLLVSKAAVSEP